MCNRPEFDNVDRIILQERQAAFDKHATGPRVGDYLILPDGEALRFTYHWGDSIQTTVRKSHVCADDQSFYFGRGGYCDFSGSLDRAIPIGLIETTTEMRDGAVWFFHHGETGAHRGVYTKARFRVYRALVGGTPYA